MIAVDSRTLEHRQEVSRSSWLMNAENCEVTKRLAPAQYCSERSTSACHPHDFTFHGAAFSWGEL